MSNPYRSPVANPIPVTKFIDQAAIIFNVSAPDITGRTYGNPAIKDSRSAVMAALRELRPDIVLKTIGSILGDRHYTTILYLKEKHEDLLFSDKQYSCRYNELLEKLSAKNEA